MFEFLKVIVVRHMFEKIPTVVAPWEIPILQEVYGETSVLTTSGMPLWDAENGETNDTETVMVEREIKAGEEYARLERKYGIHPEEKTPFVRLVFGSARERKLDQVIRKAYIEPADTNQDGEVDRDEVKNRLDELGVEYNPNSRTQTLKEILDEAEASLKVNE